MIGEVQTTLGYYTRHTTDAVLTFWGRGATPSHTRCEVSPSLLMLPSHVITDTPRKYP